MPSARPLCAKRGPEALAPESARQVVKRDAIDVEDDVQLGLAAGLRRYLSHVPVRAVAASWS
jgi:hypothetical protein